VWFFNEVWVKQNLLQVNEAGYSMLYSEHVAKVLGRSWRREILPYLTGGKGPEYPAVVACDDFFEAGVKSYAYKIPNRYLRVVRHECPDRELCRKVTVRHQQKDRELPPVKAWLKSKLNALKVRLTDAFGRIDAMGLPFRRRQRVTLKGGEKVEFTVGMYRANLKTSCELVNEGEMHFVGDNDYGRVFAPHVNLPKDLVGDLFVLYDGKEHPVVFTDLRNSQPLIALLAALLYFAGSRASRRRLLSIPFGGKDPYHPVRQMLKSWANQIQSGENPPTAAAPRIEGGRREQEGEGGQQEGGRARRNRISRIHSAIPLLLHELGKSRPERPYDDLLGGLEAACEAGFYETLMTERDRARGEGYRDRFKVRSLTSMYSETMFWERDGMKGRLKATYPSLYEFLRVLKKGGHERAARTMQLIESTIFIDFVCRRIRDEETRVSYERTGKKGLGIPVFTKHDSVGTVPTYFDYVQGVVLDEFRKLGVVPTLH
jgi:hypothetical protein